MTFLNPDCVDELTGMLGIRCYVAERRPSAFAVVTGRFVEAANGYFGNLPTVQRSLYASETFP